MAEIKSQNWFRRHWIISIFLGLFVLGIVGSLFDDSEKNLTGNVVNEQSGNEEDIRFSLESILPEKKIFQQNILVETLKILKKVTEI